MQIIITGKQVMVKEAVILDMFSYPKQLLFGGHFLAGV